MKISLSKIFSNFEKNLNKLKELKILVIGDIILDRWLKGTVDRISPEAPVPVLRVEKEWNDLGGAANVAKILSYYSNNVYLLGSIGKDQFANRVKKLIEKYNIKDLTFNYSQTIVKTRLIAQNNQQIARVDREKQDFKIPSNILYEKIKSVQNQFDSIFLIDYDKGMFSYESVNLINEVLKSKYYISIKPNNFHSFSQFINQNKIELISLNKKEFCQISKYLLNDSEVNNGNLYENMSKFYEKLNLSNLLVTLGKEGLCLISNKDVIKIDGIEVEVFDVTGAGDNVISIFSLFDMIGVDFTESGILANIAGSICVSKPGTIAVKPPDIINFLKRYQTDYFRIKKITENKYEVSSK